MEKEQTSLLKKWWFWTIIVLTTLCIVLIYLLFAKKDNLTANTNDIISQIRKISNQSILYISNDTLLIYAEHFNGVEGELEEIMNFVKDNRTSIFKDYNKLITISLIDNSKDEYLILKQELNLFDFSLTSDKTYIDFEDYKKLFNKYEGTMEDYTDLFTSIY
ncbi:MAG: hypothetical protein HFJ30_00165 [Clostridia bacterium]|nr:hypothetical protein [Clostridia bacterium]